MIDAAPLPYPSLQHFMKRIFIVEDHAIIRDTFRHVIEQSEGLTVCGTAGTFEEGATAIPDAAPDLVVMDVSLGRDSPDGIELIRRLRGEMKESAARWLVVTLHDGELARQRAREAGAHGFLAKEQASTSLTEAIWKVLKGTGTEEDWWERGQEAL